MAGVFRDLVRRSPGATGRRFAATLVLLLTCGIAIALPASAAWPPPLAPAAERADEIHVVKHQRRMDLLRKGKVIRSYSIRLGDQPRGHKRQQGDERTPEGRYAITYRNPKSAFHLSLRISYPNAADRAQARARGVDPGGDIVIHGGTPPGYWRDWTDGCIALMDKQMEEVWSLVPTGTPIVIDP
jgi:murein L,D-transpeptidase YafK